MKKFEDKDRPHGRCYDCGKPYKKFEDLSIDDELWEKINPTIHAEAGLLCPTCILDRLVELGFGEFNLKTKLRDVYV